MTAAADGPPIRALCLFVGHPRQSDLRAAFAGALSAAGSGRVIEFEEVDIQRGGSADDLTVLERQTRLLMRIVNHEFAAIFLSPPRNTFTRATFANYLGPSPVRSFEFPWASHGTPPSSAPGARWAPPLALFSLRVVATAAIVTSPVGSGPVLAVLEHPKDLGEALRGTPASIWQFDQALACEDLPLMRSGALF